MYICVKVECQVMYTMQGNQPARVVVSVYAGGAGESDLFLNVLRYLILEHKNRYA